MIFRVISSKIPQLKEKIRSAGLMQKPEDYVKESLVNSFFMSLMICVLLLFMILKAGKSPIILLFIFVIIFFSLSAIFLKRIDVIMVARAREIDKDVLFAGRFLLVKLNSGKPLINSIIDASNSYGVASKYFKEIVRDIELGTPLEIALENAYRSTPSKKFKKILFQINNALKIGVDVSIPLESTLEEISHEQLLEIQRYGKKLNFLTMFYMLVAIVIPSLGITLFSVIASMVSIHINLQLFLVALFFLIILQLMFLTLFRSIRPNLNI